MFESLFMNSVSTKSYDSIQQLFQDWLLDPPVKIWDSLEVNKSPWRENVYLHKPPLKYFGKK